MKFNSVYLMVCLGLSVPMVSAAAAKPCVGAECRSKMYEARQARIAAEQKSVGAELPSTDAAATRSVAPAADGSLTSQCRFELQRQRQAVKDAAGVGAAPVLAPALSPECREAMQKAREARKAAQGK